MYFHCLLCFNKLRLRNVLYFLGFSDSYLSRSYTLVIDARGIKNKTENEIRLAPTALFSDKISRINRYYNMDEQICFCKS